MKVFYILTIRDEDFGERETTPAENLEYLSEHLKKFYKVAANVTKLQKGEGNFKQDGEIYTWSIRAYVEDIESKRGLREYNIDEAYRIQKR